MVAFKFIDTQTNLFSFQGMVEELSSGPCVAMEIVSKDKTQNTAVEFRKLVGPSDPVREID